MHSSKEVEQNRTQRQRVGNSIWYFYGEIKSIGNVKVYRIWLAAKQRKGGECIDKGINKELGVGMNGKYQVLKYCMKSVEKWLRLGIV